MKIELDEKELKTILDVFIKLEADKREAQGQMLTNMINSIQPWIEAMLTPKTPKQ